MSDRVPTRFVRTLLRMVGDRGYDFSAVLNDAGLDFDPLNDGSYSLETRGAASLDLDIDAGVAGSAVVRVLPFELVPIGGSPTA